MADLPSSMQYNAEVFLRERDEARAERDRLKEGFRMWKQTAEFLAKQNKKNAEEAHRLREALGRYALHDRLCPAWGQRDESACNCGLMEALNKADPPATRD